MKPATGHFELSGLAGLLYLAMGRERSCRKGKYMDKLDEKLLDELELHGFQKPAVLTTKLGIGAEAIRRRMNRMISKEIIKVIAVPNPISSEYRARADIGIKVAPGYACNVTRQLIGNGSVYFVTHCFGEFDLWISVRFPTFDRLAFFVSSELPRIKGILAAETMQVVYYRKYYRFSWPAPILGKSSTGRERWPDAASNDVYQIDEIDRRILDMLMQDGLARPAVLKAKLGISESTVRKRVKNMLDKGLFSIEVVPNPGVLPYEVWAYLGMKIIGQSADKVIDALVETPALYAAGVTLGRFNVMIAVRFHHMDWLDHFLSVELPTIEGIASIQPFLFTRPLKYHNIDWSHLLHKDNYDKTYQGPRTS